MEGAIGAVFVIGLSSGLAFWISTQRWGWLPVAVIDNIWWLPAAAGLWAAVDILVVPWVRYRVHRWEVSADIVYTRTGGLTRHWQLVPINRMQTVDRTQGWLDRLFRLATVEMKTASHAGSSTISGLDEPEATRLAEDLATRAGRAGDDAT
ncbi:PH domain-containing protein [Allonocardiopsis opalescens]|uniref:YdbS-like PH domain-containing protein n=1 Tax=Allonocardiopsis opalescens TaxID=1144618 RepID=A0A2T0PUP1_9ACTN|nr:PH domain-containing protein [Allonocardiopsis opalescens]PRX92446.1 hypothetical protein CLV72_110206 [Allonocardiopsis opalescens]